MVEIANPMADFVSHLLSLGLGKVALTETVRLAEVAFGFTARDSGSAAARRDKERLKKARQRARRAGIVPGDTEGTAMNAIYHSESKPQKVPKKEIAATAPVPGDKGDKPKRSGTRLPEDWKPTEADVAYGATKLKLTSEQVLILGEDMRLWAVANANRSVARKDNWTLTFYGWMRREARNITRNGGHNEKTRTPDSKLGFAGIAARARYGAAGPERPAPEDLEPVNGRRHP